MRKATAKTRQRHFRISQDLAVGEWKVIMSTIYGEIFIRRTNTVLGYEYLIGRRGNDPGEYLMGTRTYKTYDGAKSGIVKLWMDSPKPSRQYVEPDTDLERYRRSPPGQRRKRNITRRRDKKIRRDERAIFVELAQGKRRTIYDGEYGKVNILRAKDGTGPWFEIAVRGGRGYKLDVGETRRRRARKGLKGYVYRSKLYQNYYDAFGDLKHWAIMTAKSGEKVGDRFDMDNF